jgi:hypothetical protein
MRTSFHHQPEAQHPKSPAIETPAGRLPHLCAKSRHSASYSITSSAVVNSDGGTASPSTFAVLWLMTNSIQRRNPPLSVIGR